MDFGLIKTKFTALLIICGVAFNSFFFLFSLQSHSYLNTDFSKSFNAAAIAANPLDIINKLMEKTQNGHAQNDKPAKAGDAKNAAGDYADRAFSGYNVLPPVLSELKIQAVSYNFMFMRITNAASNMTVSVLTERTQYDDYSGVLRLFAFLLMYLALLRDGSNIKLLSLNKNAAA